MRGSQWPRVHLTAPSTLQISPEEEERRRVRRERNKLAAAKCRNRRKELTDFLQAVSTGRRVYRARLPPAGGTPAVRHWKSPPPSSLSEGNPSEKRRKTRFKKLVAVRPTRGTAEQSLELLRTISKKPRT